MRDETKTKKQLIKELSELRKQLAKLKKSLNDCKVSETECRVAEKECKIAVAECKQSEAECRLSEKVLHNLSIRDELTGLYNRRGFLTLGEQQLKTAHRLENSVLLIFADLDHMKWINDKFGHYEGDRALIKTTEILKEVFRESDIIARIGGDEFVVLAMETHDTNEDMITIRLNEKLDAYNAGAPRRYMISLSIGVANYDPKNPCSIEELLTRADTSMYKQKRKKQKDTSFTFNQ
jgi:diguanylate cyclase (GGDEF)-like protein